MKSALNFFVKYGTYETEGTRQVTMLGTIMIIGTALTILPFLSALAHVAEIVFLRLS